MLIITCKIWWCSLEGVGIMTMFCWIFYFCLKTINSCVSLLFTNLFCANSKMFSVQKWKKAQKTISWFLSSLLRKLEKPREESVIKRCKTLFQILSIIDKLYTYRPYLKPSVQLETHHIALLKIISFLKTGTSIFWKI